MEQVADTKSDDATWNTVLNFIVNSISRNTSLKIIGGPIFYLEESGGELSGWTKSDLSQEIYNDYRLNK